MNRKYTQEHIDYIAVNIPGCSFKELTNMFNKKYGMNLKVSTMISLSDRHGLHNGRDTRLNKGYEPTQFKRGQAPFNKGRKGVFLGGKVAKAAQFKKGHRPWNYQPVGTERVNGDDYVDIKIADPNKWKGKHILIWEKHNGPVPKGHPVIFGDGNRRNFDLENLILVSRKQLVRLNQCNLIQNDVELTKSGIIIADIYNKIGERKRCGVKRNS
jgi:hypothetical protein